MSSIPLEGYLYSQCHFKDEEKKQLDLIFNELNLKLEKYGLKDLLIQRNFDNLKSVSLNNLKDIVENWNVYIDKLEDVHFKVAVIKEFRSLNMLVEKAEEEIKLIKNQIEELELNLKKKYSETISHNYLFNDYFSFKDFKKKFDEFTNDSLVSTELLERIKKEDLFKIIRRKIISEKANFIGEMNNSKDNVIHIGKIKEYDQKSYDLLRNEFLQTICEDSLNLKFNFGKESHTEIVRPSHSLSKSLKIEKTEIVYLTVSLNPIEDLDIKVGNLIDFSNGMKFEVTKEQQVVEKEMFYQLELDQIITCNLLVPVYFSFIRCNLVKEQRSDHLKQI